MCYDIVINTNGDVSGKLLMRLIAENQRLLMFNGVHGKDSDGRVDNDGRMTVQSGGNMISEMVAARVENELEAIA